MKMNMRKNRFWTLSRQAGGFTLVELIVVIAILAILAGVAIPVYSGYIKRADRAADEQLLATINQAFASACLQNGVDVHSLTTANIDLEEDGKVNLDSVSPYKEAFAQFYAGNENAEFKVIKSLAFDALLHTFVDGASETITINYAGTNITISGANLQKLRDSAFNQKLTMAELMEKIEVAAGVVQIAGINSPLYTLANCDDAQAFMLSMLGTTEDEQGERFERIFTSLVNSGMSEDEALKQMQSYNVVLMASQSANDVKDDVLTLLKSDKNGDEMKAAFVDAVEGDNANAKDGLAQIAMAYGLYTSYIARYPDRASEGDNADPYAVLSELGTDEFKAYLDTPEAQKDLDGYLSSMNMISNDVTDKPDAVEELLTNGFATDDLVDLLTGLT